MFDKTTSLVDKNSEISIMALSFSFPPFFFSPFLSLIQLSTCEASLPPASYVPKPRCPHAPMTWWPHASVASRLSYGVQRPGASHTEGHFEEVPHARSRSWVKLLFWASQIPSCSREHKSRVEQSGGLLSCLVGDGAQLLLE